MSMGAFFPTSYRIARSLCSVVKQYKKMEAVLFSETSGTSLIMAQRHIFKRREYLFLVPDFFLAYLLFLAQVSFLYK